MTISLHWWHIPTLATVAFVLWMIVPYGARSVWDDFQTVLGTMICVIILLLVWVAFAVSAILTGGW